MELLGKFKRVPGYAIFSTSKMLSCRTNRHGEFRSKATKEERTIRNFVPQLNRLLVGALAPDNDHLASAELDTQPRVEAFWSLGGIEPDKTLRKARKENERYQGQEEDSIDR